MDQNQLSGQEDRPGRHHQIRREADAPERNESHEDGADQPGGEQDQQGAVGAGQLHGESRVRADGHGERDQRATQHHVQQLQPMRTQPIAERRVQEPILQPLPAGGHEPADPDDRRQDDHEYRDRQEAVAEAAVPRRDRHQHGERKDQIAAGEDEPTGSLIPARCIGHRQRQGQGGHCQSRGHHLRAGHPERDEQREGQLWLPHDHRQRQDDDRGDDDVATPPGDRRDRFDAIGWRGECQQQPDDGRRVGERHEPDDHCAEQHRCRPARGPGPDP